MLLESMTIPALLQLISSLDYHLAICIYLKLIFLKFSETAAEVTITIIIG